MEEKILTAEMQEALRDNFMLLEKDVALMVFTQKGANDQFNEFLVKFITEFSRLDKRIKAEFHDIGDAASKKYSVERSPTLLVSPDKYDIRFTGAPLGEEGRTFVTAVIMASTGRSFISEDSKKRLGRLKEKRHVRVFVSPTCPYCPQQALYAVSAAVERSDLVSAEMTEIYENRDLAEKSDAMSVPRTFIDDKFTAAGLEPEEYFMESLIKGAPVEFVLPAEGADIRDYDVIILGGGPAGLTAAIYTERSGLKSVVFEKGSVGGQVAITPIVENYPGFPRITGKTLVDMMARQAMDYAPVVQGISVNDIKQEKNGFEVQTGRGIYRAKAIIMATGAAHKTLGVPGEKPLSGRGVSYCATCDGYLFRDGKHVLVVGGGNSALTDALYLDSIGAHVRVVHRRDSFRAEARLVESLTQRNIPVLFNTLITEIMGTRVVEKAKLENLKTLKKETVDIDGVFISIGYSPNNELARKLGLKLDEQGYIEVKNGQRTTMPLVYAAGDIAGGEKQIAVAVGQGSTAAISVFEDLAKPYWKQKL